MHPLVQAAITATRQGNSPKATELLREALSANPNDIEAWLVLSRLVEQPDRQRQCLNRVLTLDPSNKLAREELLKLDRAAMSAPPVRPTPDPASVQSSSSFVSSSISSAELPTIPPDSAFTLAASDTSRIETPVKAQLQRSPNIRLEKPLVFRYSGIWLVVLYLSTSIFCCTGFLVASQDVAQSLPSFMVALLFGLTILSVSSKVEMNDAGVRASTLFSGTEIKWNDIASIKSNSISKKLELSSNKGKLVKISTQVKGYPVVIELLRQKRPDLFGEGVPSPAQGNRSAPGDKQPQSTPAPAFTGTKTFKKSSLKQYSITVVGFFFCLILVLLLSSVDINWDFFAIFGILLGVAFGALLILIPFFQVGTVKVEPNKLTLATFLGEKEVSAPQIQEIEMKSVTGRYGRVTNFVNIRLVEGKNYSLGGFPAGEEIIYGFLMNWWNTYRNR